MDNDTKEINLTNEVIRMQMRNELSFLNSAIAYLEDGNIDVALEMLIQRVKFISVFL